MRCYRKILHISYKDHATNEEVRAKTQQTIGPHDDFLMIVKIHKLQWYGHVSCSSGLAKTILQGTVKGGRRQDRGRGGKTTSGNGQAWSLPSPRGQWRTGKNGENCLWNHLWCPSDPCGEGIDNDDHYHHYSENTWKLALSCTSVLGILRICLEWVNARNTYAYFFSVEDCHCSFNSISFLSQTNSKHSCYTCCIVRWIWKHDP